MTTELRFLLLTAILTGLPWIPVAIGFSKPLTRFCAVANFCARLAHALIHISGIARFRARTVAFSVAWAASITFAIVLLRHAT